MKPGHYYRHTLALDAYIKLLEAHGEDLFDVAWYVRGKALGVNHKAIIPAEKQHMWTEVDELGEAVTWQRAGDKVVLKAKIEC